MILEEDSEIRKHPENFMRCVLYTMFIFAIVCGVIFRFINFFGVSLNFEHNGEYLKSLGQMLTGRLVSYGDSAGYFTMLGPLIFYLYSALLKIWASPVCLMVFSLVQNFASMALVYWHFRRRIGLFAALSATAFLASLYQHVLLAGDIYTNTIVSTAALAWLHFFLKGIEENSPGAFVTSFIFLSFATNGHFSGFLLIPAGICIFVLLKPRLDPF